MTTWAWSVQFENESYDQPSFHLTSFERRKEDEIVISDKKPHKLFVDFVNSVSETDSHPAYSTLETGSFLALFFLSLRWVCLCLGNTWWFRSYLRDIYHRLSSRKDHRWFGRFCRLNRVNALWFFLRVFVVLFLNPPYIHWDTEIESSGLIRICFLKPAIEKNSGQQFWGWRSSIS